MKEILGLAWNDSFTFDGKKLLVPSIEMVLIVSEPQWGYDAGGGMTQRRMTETFRIVATPDHLRDLAKQILKRAEEADGNAKVCMAAIRGDVPPKHKEETP